MISGHTASVFLWFCLRWLFPALGQLLRRGNRHSGHLHRTGLQKCQRTRRCRRAGCDNVVDQQHPPAGQVCAGAAAKRAPGVLQALLAGKLLLRAAPALDVQRCLHRDPPAPRPTGAPAAAADPAYRAAAGGAAPAQCSYTAAARSHPHTAAFFRAVWPAVRQTPARPHGPPAPGHTKSSRPACSAKRLYVQYPRNNTPRQPPARRKNRVRPPADAPECAVSAFPRARRPGKPCPAVRPAPAMTRKTDSAAEKAGPADGAAAQNPCALNRSRSRACRVISGCVYSGAVLP